MMLLMVKCLQSSNSSEANACKLRHLRLDVLT